MEDLDCNPFFRALRTTHRDIWLATARNQWLVTVPQASSLRGGTDREDIETHVLQPSRSFPGEFLTLQGNVVTVVGNEILTKSGFAEPRRVKILYTEEFTEPVLPLEAAAHAKTEKVPNSDATLAPTPSSSSSSSSSTASGNGEAETPSLSSSSGFSSASTGGSGDASAAPPPAPITPTSKPLAELTFSVIHISRPLIGGVNAPSSADEMDRSVIVKYMAMLRSFPEHEPVMLRLDDFVRRTNQYLSEHKLPDDGSLEGFLKSELDHAVATLLNSPCFQSSMGSQSSLNRRKTRSQLSQVLESYLLEGIHARVFSRLSEIHASDDRELTRILDGMVEWTQSDLKMRAEFQCPVRLHLSFYSRVGIMSAS